MCKIRVCNAKFHFVIEAESITVLVRNNDIIYHKIRFQRQCFVSLNIESQHLACCSGKILCCHTSNSNLQFAVRCHVRAYSSILRQTAAILKLRFTVVFNFKRKSLRQSYQSLHASYVNKVVEHKAYLL